MIKSSHMLVKYLPLALFAVLLPSAGLHAQTYTDLYDFSCESGCEPIDLGQLTQGLDGNLYGTTRDGGRFNQGTIFMVTTSGGHSELYSFDGVNGANPWGSLTLASDGNFYGTTAFGGVYNEGTVFRLTPPNTVTVLHNFTAFSPGGYEPVTPPTQAADGNLYGITRDGSIYRIMLPSGTFQLLPSSLADPGFFDFATWDPLYLASDGNLYGTAHYDNTVFRLTTDGDITTLYNFSGSSALDPDGPVTQGQGADTSLYGTTSLGGTSHTGTIYKVTLDGAFTLLHSFDGSLTSLTNIEGAQPIGGLVAASDGLLYGANIFQGANGAGTVYVATKDGSFLQKIFDFPGPGSELGGSAWATLMQHTNGILYGLSVDDNIDGQGGTFYSVTPRGPIRILKVAGPIFVRPGVPVQILGDDLTQAFSATFAGEPMQFQTNSDTYLTAQVPSDAVDGVIAVTLQTGLQIQTQSAIHILPVVTSLDPLSGPVGTQVVITGGGFSGATKVALGGAKASFSVLDPTHVLATVPPKAKTGEVKVITPNGAAKSTQTFRVN